MATYVRRLTTRESPRPSKRKGSSIRALKLAPLVLIAAGAIALRAIASVGFANYDTLYALTWGRLLAGGEQPEYWIPIAPTPHPLMEAVGFVLSPLSPAVTEQIVVWLGFLALSATCWVVFRLASDWFGLAAGLLAGAIVITRVPILSYGVRAYIDVPYLLFVLLALLMESRRPEAGAPVLWLLALAGLLRPEAWAFSGLYWIYLAMSGRWEPWLRVMGGGGAASGGGASGHGEPHAPRGRRRDAGELAWLALLALLAPTLWVASDWAITGDPLWSLLNTRHTAHALDRETGILKAPIYIPRRIGEILRPPVLVGAALGGVLSLIWLRKRALLGAVVGFAAVIVFAFLSSFGLPIDTRYAFLAATILAIFCGCGVFGWMLLPKQHRARRGWALAGLIVLAGIVAFTPSGLDSVKGQLTELKRQQRIQDDLISLVNKHAVTTKCGDVEVPGHAPIPLLSLYLEARPSEIVSDATRTISHGTYLDPASEEVEDEYLLDPHEPRPEQPPTVPPGFSEAGANASWLVFKRCG